MKTSRPGSLGSLELKPNAHRSLLQFRSSPTGRYSVLCLSFNVTNAHACEVNFGSMLEFCGTLLDIMLRTSV